MEGVYEMNQFCFSVIFIFGLSLSTILKAETVLYCKEELSTGFIKENGVWVERRFKNNRYTLKFNEQFSKLLGLSETPLECVWAYDTKNYDSLVCKSKFADGNFFNYNTKTKKFIYSQSTIWGYISDQFDDTNTISVGSCQNF